MCLYKGHLDAVRFNDRRNYIGQFIQRHVLFFMSWDCVNPACILHVYTKSNTAREISIMYSWIQMFFAESCLLFVLYNCDREYHVVVKVHQHYADLIYPHRMYIYGNQVLWCNNKMYTRSFVLLFLPNVKVFTFAACQHIDIFGCNYSPILKQIWKHLIEKPNNYQYKWKYK